MLCLRKSGAKQISKALYLDEAKQPEVVIYEVHEEARKGTRSLEGSTR